MKVRTTKIFGVFLSLFILSGCSLTELKGEIFSTTTPIPLPTVRVACSPVETISGNKVLCTSRTSNGTIPQLFWNFEDPILTDCNNSAAADKIDCPVPRSHKGGKINVKAKNEKLYQALAETNFTVIPDPTYVEPVVEAPVVETPVVTAPVVETPVVTAPVVAKTEVKIQCTPNALKPGEKTTCTAKGPKNEAIKILWIFNDPLLIKCNNSTPADKVICTIPTSHKGGTVKVNGNYQNRYNVREIDFKIIRLK